MTKKKQSIAGYEILFAEKGNVVDIFVFLLYVNTVADICTAITFLQKCHTRKGGGSALSKLRQL